MQTDDLLQPPPTLRVIAREWGRIGCVGFGGPPAHIALLRELCVVRHGWLTSPQFDRALAAVNLLPGPASTQLAIYCAWRLRGARGALLGGVLVGVLENLTGAYISPAYKEGVALMLFLVVIIFKPEGLLGKTEERKV